MKPSVCLAMMFAAMPLMAQQHLQVPRADGKQTPLLVYAAQGNVQGCAPLALISHGAGGSEYGYKYLAEEMASLGYTAVVMGHQESGRSALRSDLRDAGYPAGVRDLVADPKAEGARLMDVTAALAWSDKTCKPRFRVLLGHSMGAETTMLEAGAKDMISIDASLLGKSRFDAYVALSPEGPGVVFADDAWAGIRKPVLVLTGTRDQSLKGGPLARQVPWKVMPGMASHCQWMGVIEGATHQNFGGNGAGASAVTPVVDSTIAAFLSGVRAGACVLPAPVAGMKLQAK